MLIVEGEEWEEEEELPGASDMYQEGKAGDQGRSDVANKVPKGFVNEEEEELEEERGGKKGDIPARSRSKKTKSGKRAPASRQDVSQRKGFKGMDFDKREESINEEDIVAEVSRRVASRLMAEKQKEAAAEQLAERIFSRLTGK